MSEETIELKLHNATKETQHMQAMHEDWHSQILSGKAVSR